MKQYDRWKKRHIYPRLIKEKGNLPIIEQIKERGEAHFMLRE